MPFQTRSGKIISTWCKIFNPDRECKQRNLYLLGLLTLPNVVVFQIEPNLSENASVYIFRLTKLESNVSTLQYCRQSQSQSQDVIVIQPKLVLRHYYKAQKHSNTKCNMSSSEASVRTNQSFVCVQTDYCPIVPSSACSQLHPGLWPASSSFANLYRMSATSAKRVSQRNQCCLVHSSKTTNTEPKSAFCVSSIFGCTEMWNKGAL
jgi:hypothetical protein